MNGYTNRIGTVATMITAPLMASGGGGASISYSISGLSLSTSVALIRMRRRMICTGMRRMSAM